MKKWKTYGYIIIQAVQDIVFVILLYSYISQYCTVVYQFFCRLYKNCMRSPYIKNTPNLPLAWNAVRTNIAQTILDTA